jgi:uncharacterized protein
MKFINFLIKPASSLCNLHCRYCFYEDASLNRAQKCMGVMTQETVDVLLAQAFSTVDEKGGVGFAFQGGEPTVAGLEFFRQFVKKARKLCPPGVQISFSIQTNGTLLNEEWAEFFHAEQFLVGVSVDGFKELHNYRVDQNGTDTWNRVSRAIRLLQKYKVEANALCVVTGQCARSPEKAYNTLKKLGFDYIQFIACMDPIGIERGTMPFSLTPDAYGKFLCRVFDLWYNDWDQGQYHSVRLFDDYIHILLGDGASTCATCGRCGAYFVVEGDGSIYPCDFYVLDDWKLGRLGETTLEEMANSERANHFLKWGQEKPAECSACRWHSMCNGGCKKDWVDVDGQPHNYYCQSFRMLLDHAATRMNYIMQAEMQARRR